MSRSSTIAVASALAIAGGAVLLSRGASESVTLAWEVSPGATVTGVEQSDVMPPTWREVATFQVPANGGSFTATVAVVNGQGYWRAYTR